MIVDDLRNASHYHCLGTRFEAGMRWLGDYALMGHALDELDSTFGGKEPGRYDLDGDDLFAMVQEYDTKLKSEGSWEAHRQYADIQLVVDGSEHMGYAPVTSLIQGSYDAEGDFLPLDGDGMFIDMRAGTFMVLFPQDAHMPGMAIESPSPVRKVVVKVRL